MNPNNPFKKNIRFGLGVIFTVIEGVLSACVYMVIYLLLQMLLNDSITIEYINNFKVEKEQLLELSMQFPARAIKKLIGSGILNEIV